MLFKINRYYSFVILFIVCHFTTLFLNDLSAQKFSGSAILGANLAQIDGDYLYGFKKVGLSAGAKIGYSLSSNKNINLEFLYSERGSAVKLFESNPANKYTLRYIEIPVLFSIYDWLQKEKKYHIVRADLGFSYGALFQLQVPIVDENEFKTHDVSYIVGAGIQFTKHIGLSIRYTRSLFDMLDYTLPEPDGRNIKFRGYFITSRMEYKF